MSRHLTTFSGASRVAECPASAALPVQVHSTSGAAERGDAIHGFLEAVLANHLHHEEALAAVPDEWRETCAKIDWAAILGDVDRASVRCEVAYAISSETGDVRELGEGIKRRYDARGDEVPGTLDIEATGLDGRPVVKDFKTGRAVTPCSRNWQMRAGAYALHRKTGAEEIVAQLVYVDEDGGVTIDEHVFDAFDLADFPAELRRVLAGIDAARESVARGSVRVSEGEWCRYCPAFATCPAKTGLVRAMLPDLTTIESTIAAMTPEQVGTAWAKLKEIEPLFERTKAALREHVLERLPEMRQIPAEGLLTDIVQPDGKVVRAIVKSKDTLSASRAIELARRYGATDVDVAECMGRAQWIELRAVKPKTNKKNGAST